MLSVLYLSPPPSFWSASSMTLGQLKSRSAGSVLPDAGALRFWHNNSSERRLFCSDTVVYSAYFSFLKVMTPTAKASTAVSCGVGLMPSFSLLGRCQYPPLVIRPWTGSLLPQCPPPVLFLLRLETHAVPTSPLSMVVDATLVFFPPSPLPTPCS